MSIKKTITSFIRKPAAFMAVGVLVLASMPAQAQAQDLKIGVVNVQALLQNAPQTKASMEALQEEFAPRERSVLAKQKELEALSEKAQRDLSVMGEEERRTMERDLREGQRELQRLQQEFVEDRNLRQNEELGKLQRILLDQVEEFAKAQNFDMIVGDGVIYASGRVNVTGQILEQLQADFGQ
ncbi:MAG: OmpH family outer membrane protein [Pseudomonadota bacterium]